jgi:hypothetical protein
MCYLIVPDSVHAEARLLDIQVRHAAQELVLPAVNLHEALLVVSQSEPLVAEIAGADGVRMSAAGGRRVQTDLSLDVALGAELEGRNVAREGGRVGARRRKQVFGRVREEDDVGAVHFVLQSGEAGWDERVGHLGEDRQVRVFVDHVHAETVTGFHEHVQIDARGVQFDPSRMIQRIWGFEATDQLELARLLVLLVRPDLVAAQVCRVEVCLGRVEHHAVDTRLRTVFVVLHIGI